MTRKERLIKQREYWDRIYNCDVPADINALVKEHNLFIDEMHKELDADLVKWVKISIFVWFIASIGVVFLA